MIKTLGDRIEEIKKDSRLKIDEFVALLGVSKQSYNGWINGTYSPNSDILVKILENFPQYNAEWLLLGKGEMKKASSNSSTVAEANEVYDKPGVSKADLKNLFKKMIDEVDNL